MSVTTAEPIPKTALGTTEDLILLRLLPPAKKPPSKSTLRTTVEKFTTTPLADEQFEGLIHRLRSDGLLEANRYRLTDLGRSRVLSSLGLDRLPPQADWGTIQAKYLVPKALGLKPNADSTTKVLRDKKTLAALLLKRKFELPVGTGSTLAKVFEAIVCRELGYPGVTTLAALRERVLSDRLDSSEKLSRAELEKQFPRLLLGADGMNGLRNAILAGVFASPPRSPANGEEEPEPIFAEPFDLTTFANTVRAAARDCRTGRFGEHKVFVNHVWKALKDEPMFRGFDLTRFKEKLVEANRDHLLTLTRADLAAHLDQGDVLESETRYFNSEFHFVSDEGDER